MRTCNTMFALAILLILCLSTTAPAQLFSNGSIASMRLLTADIGWAATKDRLFWTTNAGNEWKDITPPTARRGGIASVFFLDISTGWVLLARPDQAADASQIDLASTINAGTSWSIEPVTIPNFNPNATELGGGARIFFVDQNYGWINLTEVSSSNYRFGILLCTQDGGRTWKTLPEPGVAGDLFFINRNNGWLAGGPGGQRLYVTRDGGTHWQEESLKAPPQIQPTTSQIYDVPVFTNAKQGFLPVTYSRPEGFGSALILFETNSAGKTWRPKTIVTGIQGERIPMAVVDSSVITAASSKVGLKLTTASAIGETSVTSDALSSESGVLQLSFADSKHGWILSGTKRLMLTRDGGATWADISPDRRKTVGDASPHTLDSGIDSVSGQTGSFFPTAGGPAGSTHRSTHMGFDKCAASMKEYMQAWWTFSPYYDTGIYIGGINRSCAQPNLTPQWVTDITTQGWGIFPIWAGPHAPCSAKTGTKFSWDEGTARSQGAAEADSAATAASALGLSGTIIFYDMERYEDPGGCGRAVTAFISGWVSQLHRKRPSYLAGVYGSPGNAQSDWLPASPVPDTVWISKWPEPGNPPKITIWGLSPLQDTSWTNSQRIHQYYGDIQNVNYGGYALDIDENVEDAPAAGGNGKKSYTFTTYASFPFGDSEHTRANDVNDWGQIVGAWWDSSAYHGFIVDQGNFSTFDYPGFLFTQALGINNTGYIVGSMGDFQTAYGFLYNRNSGAFTPILYPGAMFTWAFGINDAGQIVGYYRGESPDSFHAFLFDGTYKNVDPPHSRDAGAYGINGAGQVAGEYSDGRKTYGFLYSNGEFSTINYPNSLSTMLHGINNNGQSIGQTGLADYMWHGFLYDGANFTTISYPGWPETYPFSINDTPWITGAYGADGVGQGTFMIKSGDKNPLP